MFKWLCLLFVLNILFESIFLYIKSVNSVKPIDVPRKLSVFCFMPTIFMFGIWINTLYGDLETFPYIATAFIAELIVALIYMVAITVLYNMVILKFVKKKKLKPKYRVGDIVRSRRTTSPRRILYIITRDDDFMVFYGLEKGIVIPEDLIIEVVDEQK